MGAVLGVHEAGVLAVVGMPLAGYKGATQFRVGPLGAANWWDPNNEGLCVWAAYQPEGRVDFANSLVDMSGNGNDAGDPGGGNTPAWDAINGWKCDGLAHYLTTTFVPNDDQTQSVIVLYSNLGNAGFICGNQLGAGREFRVRPMHVFPGGRGFFYNGGSFLAAIGSGITEGTIALAGTKGYFDGVADADSCGPWTAPNARAIYIGAYQGVAPGGFCAVYIQAMAIYDCILTAPQMAVVDAAMALL